MWWLANVRSLCPAFACAVCCAGFASVNTLWSEEPENPNSREFYDLTVKARRVIFVLDHSKSMLSQLGGQTRLDRLRDEMDSFFAESDGSQYFDIHCFNDRLKTFRRKLVHNDDVAVKEARDFLNTQPARGKTATFDALKSAIIEGQEESAQRIIFVTDGHPTTGSIVDPHAILAALIQLNKDPLIPIDVLAYDTATYPVRRAFLQQLAYDHQGQFLTLD